MWCSAHLSGAQLLWLSASPDAALLRQVQPTVILVWFFKQLYVVIAILCDLLHSTVCDSDSLERHYYLVISLLVNENHDNPELRPGGKSAVLHASPSFFQSSCPPETPLGLCLSPGHLHWLEKQEFHLLLMKVNTTTVKVKLSPKGYKILFLTYHGTRAWKILICDVTWRTVKMDCS